MRTAPLIAPATKPKKATAGEWRRKPRTPVREQGLVRITVDIPTAQHKRLKLAAIESGVTVRQLILELLEREGITDNG